MAVISVLWASPITLVSGEAFDSVEEFSGDIDLETDGYEGVQITCDVSFHASGTKDAVILAYSSLDGVNYDDIPVQVQQVPVSAGNARQISMFIKNAAHLCLGFKTVADENDAYLPTMTIIYQRWRWQAV